MQRPKDIGRLLFVCLFLQAPLFAQTSLDIAVKESDRVADYGHPRLDPPDNELPEKTTQEQDAALFFSQDPDEETFQVETIELKGCESLSPSLFEDMLARHRGRTVSLGELKSLAKEIEREYLRQGVIAAVFIPQQQISQGSVALQVVEARMGHLEIKEHDYFDEDRLWYYMRLVPGNVLRYDELSRSLTAMNKNPDREVKAALHSGARPGTTDITLTPKTRFPVHASGSFDREGGMTTGKDRFSVGLRHNNFLGFDDALYSGYNFGKRFDGKYLYHLVPVSPDGMSFLYGYSTSSSAPAKDLESYAIRSGAETFSFSLKQDLYRDNENIGEMTVGMDAKDKTVTMSSGTYNRERLRVLKLGGRYMVKGLGNVTSFSPEISQGIEAFGASDKNNPLASRGSSSTFTRANLSLQHRRSLSAGLEATVKAEGQLSSTMLPSSELLNLGGIDSVRGYPPGDYAADTGAIISNELSLPISFLPYEWKLPHSASSLSRDAKAVLFVDYGHGRRRGNAANDEKSVNMLGAGAGLRLKLYDQANLRLEWGFPVGDDTLTHSADSWFHFAFEMQERLPEEIKRIQEELLEDRIRSSAWELVNAELSRPESPVRKKLVSYAMFAQAYYKRGRLQAAKACYEKVITLGTSLYEQSQAYARKSLRKQKELEQTRAIALAHFKEGRFSEARDLWEKVGIEAIPASFTLNY